MSDFSAADIVGKTLTAAVTVPLKRLPYDLSPEIYYVNAGQPVGVVYSYLLPSADRKNLYWMFNDANGRPFYAEHLPGRFSINSLVSQGVQTTLQKIEEQKRANEPIKDTIERNLKYVVGAIAAVFILRAVLENINKK